MPVETIKAHRRRAMDGWFEKYFVGKGIDIGCGSCPVTPDCFPWDVQNGDAQSLPGVEGKSFDWVYSSHCLEHLADPSAALRRWWEVLKPGGFLIVSVPDEDLYEQGKWPSGLNNGHLTSWTIHKDQSWSPVSRNLKDEVEALPGSEIVSIKLIDTNYNYALRDYVGALLLVPKEVAVEVEKTHNLVLDSRSQFVEFQLFDQTGRHTNAEASIEAIVRKNA
jgi:SAM-dependent methyltransferase